MVPDETFPMPAGLVDVGEDLQCEGHCFLTLELQRFPKAVVASVRYHRSFPHAARGLRRWTCKAGRAQDRELKEWVDKLPTTMRFLNGVLHFYGVPLPVMDCPHPLI